MGQFDTSLPIGSKRWWEARWERVADERDRYIARCTEVNIERQRQEVRAIEAEAEVERLRDENLKLCDYVHEAAGDESALIPVSVLQRLVYVPDEERKAIVLSLKARMLNEAGTFHELLRRAVLRLEDKP